MGLITQPSVSWNDIQQNSMEHIIELMKEKPETHLENLAREILNHPGHVTQESAKKLYKNLQPIKLPSLPFAKLSNVLVEQGIFTTKQIDHYSSLQETELRNLENAIKNQDNAQIISLVQKGQNLSENSPLKERLLATLCNSSTPWHPNVIEMIVNLLKTGCKAPHPIPDSVMLLSVLAEQNVRNPIIDREIVALVKREGIVLFGKNKASQNLLNILCDTQIDHVNLKNAILYLIHNGNKISSSCPNSSLILDAICNLTALKLLNSSNTDYTSITQKNLINAVIDLVESGHIPLKNFSFGQVLLTILGNNKRPLNPFSLNMILYLIEAGKIPPKNILEVLVPYIDEVSFQCIEDYQIRMQDVILDLVKKKFSIYQFSPLLKKFFFLLCKNIAPPTNLFYYEIKNCMTFLGDIDNVDSNKKIALDYFLEKGGVLPHLLEMIDPTIFRSWIEGCINCTEESLMNLPPGHFMLAIFDLSVRKKWLSYKNLDFLSGNKLVALAQCCQHTFNENKAYMNDILEMIKKLNFLQQKTFLESLSPSFKRRVQQAYLDHIDPFKTEKEILKKGLEKIFKYSPELKLSSHQLSRFKALENFSGYSKFGGRKNFSVNRMTVRIFNMIKILNEISIWISDAFILEGIDYLKEIVPKRASTEKAHQVQNECAQDLVNSSITNLKYETLRQAVYHLSNIENASIEEIDWDDVYHHIFDQNLSIPAPPHSTTPDFEVWKEETIKKLSEHIRLKFDQLHISTLMQLIDFKPSSELMTQHKKHSAQSLEGLATKRIKFIQN